MWDVFPDDIGLDNTIELELSNMDLNYLVLELITFDDDPHEVSSSTLVYAIGATDLGLGVEEEGEEGGGE